MIAMFYNDHAPHPVSSVSWLSGPQLHRSELLDNWSRARRMEPLTDIAPLE
jgi:hypothetical protein